MLVERAAQRGAERSGIRFVNKNWLLTCYDFTRSTFAGKTQIHDSSVLPKEGVLENERAQYASQPA
jgi:hypothetical protein